MNAAAPAFPIWETNAEGLTKVQYISTHILASMAANPHYVGRSEMELAHKAVDLAEALVEVLKQRHP